MTRGNPTPQSRCSFVSSYYYCCFGPEIDFLRSRTPNHIFHDCISSTYVASHCISLAYPHCFFPYTVALALHILATSPSHSCFSWILLPRLIYPEAVKYARALEHFSLIYLLAAASLAPVPNTHPHYAYSISQHAITITASDIFVPISRTTP
jgi:hypothetical protein